MNILNMFKLYELYRSITTKCKEDKKMQEKLASRKLWITVFTTVLTLVNGQVNIIPADTLHWLIGLVGTYLAGQSAVDAVEKNNVKQTIAPVTPIIQ